MKSAHAASLTALMTLALAQPALATTPTESVIYSFKDYADGAVPLAGLINVGGTLYGTTGYGGNGGGTVFSVTPKGSESVLVPFDYPLSPDAGLINVGGTLYGTTMYGGLGSEGCYGEGCGTLFSVNLAAGTWTQLYAFDTDYQNKNAGTWPVGRLLSVGGTLYGTTTMGGLDVKKGCNCGAVFATTLSGATNYVYLFTSNPTPAGGLIKIGGRLYGATYNSLYYVTTHGAYAVLYTFGPSPDGAGVVGDLTDVGGTLYGTTTMGGTYGAGTVFRVTSAGVETVLHSFGGTGDGSSPHAGLIKLGSALYGTTWSGGAYGSGTVFQLTLTGQETVLYSFKINSGDGAFPGGKLIAIGNTLYGTTAMGGANGYGTVFSLVP